MIDRTIKGEKEREGEGGHLLLTQTILPTRPPPRTLGRFVLLLLLLLLLLLVVVVLPVAGKFLTFPGLDPYKTQQ